MNQFTKRQKTYAKISSALACMSSETLTRLLAQGTRLHQGVGGSSLRIDINSRPIFVKKIPLTDLERRAENYMSTANIFNLPLCYQYGIGSAGFGAWRELAAHIMTTNWVITEQCPHFPMMYHWRILEDGGHKIISQEQKIALDKDVLYWGNSASINARLKARAQATQHIYLFLEYVPMSLYAWINKSVDISESAFVNAITRAHSQVKSIIKFMKMQQFLHMDAHFENILTDGVMLYFTDFGLSLSEKFTLSHNEKLFMKDHVHYDEASLLINLVHAALTSYFGKNNWEACLAQFTSHEFSAKLPNAVGKILIKYHEVAVHMDAFYKALQKDKSTSFSSRDVQKLLKECT